MFIAEVWTSAKALIRRTYRRLKLPRVRREGPVHEDLTEVAALTEQRKYDDAVALAEKLLVTNSHDKDVVRQVRATFSKAGAVTLQLAAVRAQRRIDDSDRLARQEAHVLGKWRETSAEWRPDVGGEPKKTVPASDARVLHILKVATPHRQSGYTMRTKYTLEAQRAAGLEPIAMTYLGFPRSVGISDAPPVEDIDGIQHIRLDPGPDYDLDQPYDRILEDFVMAAASRVQELAPAVIHAHSGFRGYDTALVALALGRHFGLPVVYEVRGFFESLWTSDTKWSERSETYQRRLATENRCMAEAAAVVTLSESMRAEIVARGVSADKVFVVPNGVDVDAFQPRERSDVLVERYRLSGRFTFGYVSNLDHYREGQETLIDAAVALRERGIQATALVIGDGKRRDKLEQYAKERAADDVVVFTGQVPHSEVLDYYALLDIFVVPRVHERAARLVTPLKPFEAMAAGVPLVTSDLEALREITGEGDRGRYFAAGDGGALADVLGELYADPQERASLAVRAREWVLAERQWAANGRRYAELYARKVRRASM